MAFAGCTVCLSGTLGHTKATFEAGINALGGATTA
eukprot:CAMPEP_0177731220 /NCGR_PEP_ID=MMETSP0484_2-20121128/22434_1 /TAXON_ID=354590 /ORGANISM="Rhodomonas lens, Strain RHODO" /LENGTH=34 /DNA_ID= /DNA_START= /DNA_END= /DNA_ORIENTATION=